MSDGPKVMTREDLIRAIEEAGSGWYDRGRTQVGLGRSIAERIADALMGLCVKGFTNNSSEAGDDAKSVLSGLVPSCGDITHLALIIAPDAPEAYDMEADAVALAKWAVDAERDARIFLADGPANPARRILKAKGGE